MNHNARAHSELKNKHQFDKKKGRQINKGICDTIEEHGLKKGAEILTETLLRCEKNDIAEREDRKKKRKSAFIVILTCVVGGILITCLIELICRKLNLNDVWRKILQYVPVLIESIIIIITAFLERTKMPEGTRFRKDGESYAEGIIEWIKDLGRRFSQASGLHFLILLMVTTLSSTLIAQCEPMKHIKAFFSGGMYAITHCDDNNNITDSGVLADSGAYKISASYEMKQYLASADEMMIEQLDKAEVTNEQRNMVLHLSDEDKYSIFTCWGNGLDGYETQEQLNDIVLSTVRSWCDEKRDNVFDREPEQGGAPQKDKNDIGQASENERPDDSFSDIEARLDLRESIAKNYPKRTLMLLIANGYQDLALRLVWHGGVQSTVIYNYGQSILFDFECLKFADNTGKLIKQRLTIIAQRYADIAYVCPDYERAEEARSLAVAFRYAADQY